MDKIKIGEFIANCRKDKLLTQEKLAEMLNVTSKSVSKWENGNCLPDTSLYEPLCNILDISINELFAGEKFKDKDLIGIKHVTGGSITDSFLVDGVAFKKSFSYAGITCNFFFHSSIVY